MIVKLDSNEIASAITQAVGRQLSLPNGTHVKVRLTCEADGTIRAEADVGDVTAEREMTERSAQQNQKG